MAQLAISAAGAAVGFAIGGPTGAQIGWAVGSAVGSMLAPPQHVSAPRLADLKVSGSSYGSPIPYVEGHPRVPATVIWASDKYAVTSTTTTGGKGGPSVETESVTYKVDMLVLLSANEIAGVRRIWSNGALVWTMADNASGTSLDASAATVHWDSITVYGGDAAQLPDPTYEAAQGAGNAPAYRGRGTVAIVGLNLGASGTLPNLTFEVVQTGEAAIASAFLKAPLKVDNDDDIAPTCSLSVLGGSSITHDGVETTISANAGAGITQIRYIENKLDVADSAYTGQRIAFALTCRSGSLAGTSNQSQRFFEYSNGSNTAGFLFFVSSGAVTIRSYYYKGSSSPVDVATDDGLDHLYEVAFEADGTTIAWYIDGTQVRTINAGARSGWGGVAGSVYVSLPYVTSVGVQVGVASMIVSALVGYLGNAAYTFAATDVGLDGVVERLCVRAGLGTGDVDVTALAPYSVRSLAVGQVMPTRGVLEMLAGVYRFEAVESLGKLKFVMRGGASAATLAYASMGASAEGEPGEPLPLRLLNDVETPAQVTVRYVNVSDDYQDGAESSDRLLGPGRAVQVMECPVGLTPQEARTLADVQVMDVAGSQRTFGPVALSNDYAHLEPTDVVTLTDTDGSTYRGRVLKMRSGGGVHTLEGVIEDASILASTIATTTTGYTDSTDVAALADTVLELLDIPLLRDADEGPGFYVAVKGGGTPWPGCVLYGSPDDVTYTQLTPITDATQIGTCSTTLGAWTGGTVFDEKNTVTVNVGATAALSSWSRDAILAGTATGYLIGSELIYARTATLVSPGVYTLSGLLRGRRGTEWAMGTHGASERCVAIPANGSGLRRVAISTTQIGKLLYVKAVTAGRALSTATAKTLTCAGISQKCLAPVDLRQADDGSTRTVTWRRRTRGAPRFTGSAGISVPLFETSESYTVELRDGGAVLVSTEVVTGTTWTHASAGLSGYSVTVMQRGAVGDGYAASVTLT